MGTLASAERSPDLQRKDLLASEGIHWPDAIFSLQSACPTELPGFEAERGLLRNPAGSLAAVTWAPMGSVRRLECPCSKARDTGPDYSGSQVHILVCSRSIN